MKNTLILIILLCLNSIFLSAQSKENLSTTITGVIIDSLSGKVVDYPTVALFNDSLKLIKAVAGGADGKFYLPSPSKGKYILSVSMIGYSTVKREITIPEGAPKQFNIGTIYMIEGVQMSAVTVIGVKPLIKSEPDKLTYNLDSDPQTSSSALVDIIRKVPMLSVDGDGTVRMNGETNFKVLVNGRAVGILVKNFKDAIKAMPANSVKSIEIITNPPAKYDAEGVGGIINIITNRSTTSGYSGSVTTGINTLGGYNVGGYISAQTGKLALSANINQGTSISNKNSNRMEAENYLSTDYRFSNTTGTSDSRNKFTNLSMDISYDIDSLNLLTFSGWGYLGSSSSQGVSNYLSYNTQHILTRSYSNSLDADYLYGTGAGSLSYQRTYKKPDQNLTISYNIDAGPTNTNTYSTIEQTLNYFDYSQHSDNDAHEVDHTFQIDYYNPISKKHNIETGAKYILRQSISNTKITLLDTETGDWIEDLSKVHDLDYNQHIVSYYGGYNYKFKSIIAKAGFRMEYTLNDGLSKSADGNISFTNKQFDVVPYINLSYKLNKGQMISLSFTQRLNRPSIWYLNPYVDDSNPMFISYGNPALKSIKRNSIGLDYRKNSQKWNVGISLYGDYTNNNITRIQKVDENGISSTTYDNIGIKKGLRLNLNYQYRMGEKFGTYMSGSVAYNQVSSKEMDLSNSGFSFNGIMGASIGLWKKAYTSFNLSMYGGDVTLQSTNSIFTYTNISLNQRLFKDKLTFSVSLNQPFTKRFKYSNDSQDQTHKIHTESFYNQRSANFGINWRFGKFNANVKKARKSSSDDKMSSGENQGGTK